MPVQLKNRLPPPGPRWDRALVVARTARGLTGPELAARIGCHPSYVALIETQRRTPNAAWLTRACVALAIPDDTLLALANAHPSRPPLPSHRLIVGSWVLAALAHTAQTEPQPSTGPSK